MPVSDRCLPMTNEQEAALRAVLTAALPYAAIENILGSLHRLSPEQLRRVGKIIRGKADWSDWLSFNEGTMEAKSFRDLYLNQPLDEDAYTGASHPKPPAHPPIEFPGQLPKWRV